MKYYETPEYPPFELHELSYQIMFDKTEKKYSVVEVQDIDNFDNELMLKDKDDSIYRFEASTEGKKQARAFLNKVIKPEFITDEDLVANNENMFKIPKDEWDEE